MDLNRKVYEIQMRDDEGQLCLFFAFEEDYLELTKESNPTFGDALEAHLKVERTIEKCRNEN